MKPFQETVAALKQSGDFFSADQPVFIARAPGRIDLMGGNVDYTGGLVFQATIREATWAAIQLRNDDRFVFWNPQLGERGWQDRVEFSTGALASEDSVRAAVNRDDSVRWTAYAFGVFYLLRRDYPEQVLSGANILIESEIPMNKGVSSSAAIEVSVMSAAARAYDIELQGIDMALACQWVENTIAGAGCGIMDQAAVVLGDEGHVLPLLCQPCCVSPLVKLPDGLQTWAIDSGVSHMVSGIEYEAVRAASFMGYKMICDWEGLPVVRDDAARVPRFTDPRWNGYLSDVEVSVFRSRYECRLPQQLRGAEYTASYGAHADPFSAVRPEVVYRVRACTRYSVEENQRIRLFVELARSSHDAAWQLMGDLMYQSHWSYSECGLGCEATDLLVDLVRQEGATAGLYGARVSGGGAGGTVVVLGRKSARPAFERVVAKYAAARDGSPYVFEGSSAGSERFGIQVV
jgi:galactokinase